MNEHIFREYDIRGIVGEHLNGRNGRGSGEAIGTFFRQNDAKRIAVGYDARESSPGFCELLTEDLTKPAAMSILIGSVPTPVLYHTVFTRDVRRRRDDHRFAQSARPQRL